ncbi:glycosyltransferase family 4 protein [Chloroflexus sp.]|uniref:glycosyltransferase family 4 protein n=1 Tax=Chloroflexus sp. TaxID=1904827 RepID=UPI0026249F4E|nr:glycosyltransferase family 4 protein [uncultured Chloroflexus sp.]
MGKRLPKTLVVATNPPVPELAATVSAGKHPRVDYLELAAHFRRQHVDYGIVRPQRLVQHLEQMLRMDLRLAARVAWLVRREGYEAVVSLSERVGIPLALLLPRAVRHLVIFHHGMSAQKLRLIRALKLQYHWDVTVAISQAEAKGMQRALNIEPQRMIALHTPVDTSFYRPAIGATTATVVQSLGLSHRDYPTFIQAMRRLPHIPCHLRVGSSWVSGAGGHEREQLPANISLELFVPIDQLRLCYLQSRIVVVPIRPTTQWSAGCTSVQAAQAMGRPVVATRRPGLAEYVIENETALLVEPGNAEQMAAAIATLWDNPQRAEQMGRAGRALMNERFAFDQWMQHMTGLVEWMMDCPIRAVNAGKTGSVA